MNWVISFVLLLLISCGHGEFPQMEKVPTLWKIVGDSMCRNVPTDYEHNGHECFYIDDYPEEERRFECFRMDCKTQSDQDSSQVKMSDKTVCMFDSDLNNLLRYINTLQSDCKVWDNKSNYLFNLKLWKSSQTDNIVN